MKHRILAASLLLILLILSGCNAQTAADASVSEPTEARLEPAVLPENTPALTEIPAVADAIEPALELPEEAPTAAVMVAVFSGTGHTRRIAQVIADGLGTELLEIIPSEPYTEEDLNYNDSSTRATVEQNDPAARPEIAEPIEGLEDCDILFLGYPIWWGQEPRILDTFVETYDLTGTTVVPFCTSGSSGIGTSVRNLSALEAEAIWLDGKRFETNASNEEINAWAAEMLAAAGQ